MNRGVRFWSGRLYHWAMHVKLLVHDTCVRHWLGYEAHVPVSSPDVSIWRIAVVVLVRTFMRALDLQARLRDHESTWYHNSGTEYHNDYYEADVPGSNPDVSIWKIAVVVHIRTCMRSPGTTQGSWRIRQVRTASHPSDKFWADIWCPLSTSPSIKVTIYLLSEWLLTWQVRPASPQEVFPL